MPSPNLANLISSFSERLPAAAALPALRAALSSGRGAVLTAPPGSGKTTLVPLALLDEPFLDGKKIIMLEPRRVAARAAAWRMADMLGEECGKTVGYATRFEREMSGATRVVVLTEGLFTRRILDDPALEDAGLVIFDEFHERSLNTDFGLALALDSQRGLRPDLRLLVMSATLDAAPVARFIGAEIVAAEGRMFPVETRFVPQPPNRRIAEAAAAGARRALAETSGSILVFLPGEGEIKAAAEILEDDARRAGAGGGSRGADADAGAASANAGAADILPLYAALPKAEQDRVLRPSPRGRRKVVLATSIAESSLTIEGIGAVVDCGFARVSRFSPESGMSRLETIRVTRDRADQRAGRAGRLGPGVCFRLWSREDDAALRSSAPPEIIAADLAPLVLQTADWSRADPATLDWLSPPPLAAWKQAVELLRGLGALSKDLSPTTHGREMSRLGIHPRLAHALIRAAQSADPAALETAALISACLSENVAYRESSNISHLLAELENPRGAISSGARQRVRELAKTLARQARGAVSANAKTSADAGTDARAPLTPGALLALAFPDRVGRRRPLASDAGRYLLACGRGAKLRDNDPLAASDWICAAELDDASAAEAQIRLAAPLAPAEIDALFSDRFERGDIFEWNDRLKRVDALERETLDAITVRERPAQTPDPARLLRCLCDGIRREGLERLGWTDSARNLQSRIQTTAAAMPEEHFPDVSDTALTAALEDWLSAALYGKRSLKEAAEIDLHSALTALLGASARRLETLAPTHLQVPSGSHIKIDYTGGQPALSARIQECFGMTATPRICAGRIPILLKLLSPGQQPVQITSDLESFWRAGYAEVRKDLRGRYPKHYWPEDPTTAIATRRVRPHPPAG